MTSWDAATWVQLTLKKHQKPILYTYYMTPREVKVSPPEHSTKGTGLLLHAWDDSTKPNSGPLKPNSGPLKYNMLQALGSKLNLLLMHMWAKCVTTFNLTSCWVHCQTQPTQGSMFTRVIEHMIRVLCPPGSLNTWLRCYAHQALNLLSNATNSYKWSGLYTHQRLNLGHYRGDTLCQPLDHSLTDSHF